MLELSKDRELKKLIVDLNTQSQLYDEGINRDGISLGEYSAYTIQKKEELGQPTDRITLKDTGDFYKTFKVEFIAGDLIIYADPFKTSHGITTDLVREFGKEIIGLTDDNLDLVVTVMQKKVIEIIKKQLGT
jgi:hypothetical protein